jgi:hypothetical protein
MGKILGLGLEDNTRLSCLVDELPGEAVQDAKLLRVRIDQRDPPGPASRARANDIFILADVIG